MRLVRYWADGSSHLGALGDTGEYIVELAGAAASLLKDQGDPLANEEAELRLSSDTATFLCGGPRSLMLAQHALDYALAHRARAADKLFRHRSTIRLQAPLVPRLILCGGGNFWGHLRESGRDKPEHVEFFLKNSHSVLGPEDDIPYDPRVSRKLDYEAELGIVIGKRGRSIPREEALNYVFGYTAVNDLAIRDRQLVRWDGSIIHVKYGEGKIFDGNVVLGPTLVTADEIGEPMNLSLRCWVDGERRQDSNTSAYIWGVAEVIEYYSSMMTLEPGFLICPGTPGGCAVGSDPACGGQAAGRASASEYLRPGQTVAVEVGQIGRIENRVSDAIH